MKKSYYFLMLLAIVTFFVTCKPKPEPEPEPTYNLTFWTNEDFGGVIVVNLYNNGGYDKEGFISKVYSSLSKYFHLPSTISRLPIIAIISPFP